MNQFIEGSISVATRKVILNGKVTVVKRVLTYEEICQLVNQSEASIIYWEKGSNKTGTLIRGQSLVTNDKMVIDAIRTGSA